MEVLACPMGNSPNRLYSALTHTLSSGPLSQPPPAELDQDPDQDLEPVDPVVLLRECEEALRTRPARLLRAFICQSTDGRDRRQQPIRVMQWNILAQALGEGMDNFVRCPLEALKWNERKYLILEEILNYQPDVLCLQEVDHYFDTFRPVLARLGYQSSFCPKPWSPCLDVVNNNGPDGCALFFRGDRFQLLGTVHLQLAAMKLKTNQVAVVSTLCCRATGRTLCVAVTHLKARSGWERLRSAQGHDLLRNLQNITQEAALVAEDGSVGVGGGVPLLVCGDFNAEPSEEVYRCFATSSLGLDSAYKQLSSDGQTEPPYTTWKIRPSGESCHTLDYIWYSRQHLTVDTVLDFPTAEQIGPDRLPSYNYPSDHLSLVCDFSFSHSPE
ncbi:nocturnin isoform X1 [Alosa sapidissima]|uniref:nocturnin isoform X1 n=2 Tax=Alosa sapidissima TaxID=34773 RepID=UPI001C080E51|nr:nocturnin isoform X1 [Alosa sapidissima]